MNRKPTKNTRGPNADEKRYVTWIKQEKITCCACERISPLIAHHCEGATFKHNKVLIGHWFVIGLCELCDSIVTFGSRREFRNRFGSQAELWLKCIDAYRFDKGLSPPEDVKSAIMDWAK